MTHYYWITFPCVFLLFMWINTLEFPESVVEGWRCLLESLIFRHLQSSKGKTSQHDSSCWWKKSQTTTWGDKTLVYNGIDYQPQLVIAGFLNHQQSLFMEVSWILGKWPFMERLFFHGSKSRVWWLFSVGFVLQLHHDFDWSSWSRDKDGCTPFTYVY